MLPDMQAGSNQLDPNLLMALNQNEGFGGNARQWLRFW